MVAARSFYDLLEILGAKDIQQLDDTRNWNFYTASFRTPAGAIKANYLYLAATCPLSEASSANLGHWKARGLYTVVTTTKSRIAADLARTASIFGATASTTPRKMLIENILEFEYISKEQIDDFRYFVEPEVKYSNESTARLKSEPALSYIERSLVRGENTGSEPVCAEILVAPAGQGKTTLCRQLANRIRSKYSDVIPVLVESNQWQRLIDLTLPNVFSAALSQIIPDASRVTNPKIFQALVREKIFIPIFDGFDELSLHPSAHFSAANLLVDFLSLVGSSDARALLTVREAFWEKHKDGFSAESVKNIRRLDLQGFSNQQRKAFFFKRLSLPEERDIANRLSREIGSRLYDGAVERVELQSERASGVPLMLELIALYVDGNSSATFVPSDFDPWGPLLEAMCERENVRQKLNMSAQNQMTIFENIFRDNQGDIVRDMLGLYVEDVVPSVSDDAIRRFESHAFLAAALDNAVQPRFETLRIYFLARWLANQLEGAVGKNALRDVANLLAIHASGSSDIFDFLVTRFKKGPREKAVAAISHASKIIRSRSNWEGASSALFHLAQRLAAELEKSRRDRTRMVVELLMGGNVADNTLERVAIQQRVSGLDLSSVTFVGCEFKNVEFYNCNFDDMTLFRDTRFLGDLSFTNCSGEGKAQVDQDSCRCSQSAIVAWEERRGRAERRREVSEEVARNAIREILKKFSGQFGFYAIKYADRDSGPVSKNPSKDKALMALISAGVIERHSVSGVREGGLNIKNDPNVRHEVRNYLDNAAVGKRLRRALDEIVVKPTQRN